MPWAGYWCCLSEWGQLAITKDTMLLGMGNHCELWDKVMYEAEEAEAMQGEMPAVLQDFSF